jgi:hypothetical protein
MERDATVEGIRRYLIHSEPYAVVYFSFDGAPETIHQAQFSEDALPSALNVGERVRILFVGQIAVGISRR